MMRTSIQLMIWGVEKHILLGHATLHQKYIVRTPFYCLLIPKMTLDFYHSNWLVFRRGQRLHILYSFIVLWITHTSPGVAYSLHFHCVLNHPSSPWCCVFSTLPTVFWITYTSPGGAHSLHFHICFELPTHPLVLRILNTFNCVLNYPYFPWWCAFSTLSHMCWKYSYIPWFCVFSTLSTVFWIIHTYPGVLYSLHFTCVLITHTSTGVAYSQHFQLCFG